MYEYWRRYNMYVLVINSFPRFKEAWITLFVRAPSPLTPRCVIRFVMNPFPRTDSDVWGSLSQRTKDLIWVVFPELNKCDFFILFLKPWTSKQNKKNKKKEEEVRRTLKKNIEEEEEEEEEHWRGRRRTLKKKKKKKERRKTLKKKKKKEEQHWRRRRIRRRKKKKKEEEHWRRRRTRKKKEEEHWRRRWRWRFSAQYSSWRSRLVFLLWIQSPDRRRRRVPQNVPRRRLGYSLSW